MTWQRNYITEKTPEENLQAGVDQLADTVKITLGPKGQKRADRQEVRIPADH